MDSTQIICDFTLESDEENEEGNKLDERGEPLAKLCILKNEHIPEKELPLFLGDNMLGRDLCTCTLPLLAPSVSKQHAMLSLSVYRRKKCESVEALIWDLGSLNGTRKGHFKLTPNVRYALSGGDSFVVADIPCKYVTCTADTPYTPKGATTPMHQNLNSKARLSDASRENGGNSSMGNTKHIAGCTKTKDPLPDSEATPARTTCLSFEQTPTQPQGTLVRDSESDSDEERASVGDRRCKNIVTDSYKSRPRCSTFLSPTNQIVPESEDESPITPSSSNKIRPHRHDGFINEQSDINIVQLELKEGMALEIVGDSEEEAETDEARAILESVHNKNGRPELANKECKASLAGGIQLPFTTPVVSADVPQFNMDSDTDLEEDERLDSAAPITLNNAQALNPAHFHMDTDTDVDKNDTHRGQDTALLSDDTTKHSHAIPVIQPKGISMDSDTDVDDEDLVSSTTAKPTVSQTANTVEVGATSPQEFHLDSDTDVDEEETNTTGMKLQDTPSQLVVKTAVAESTSAAPQSLNLDSDTDDEGILSAAVSARDEIDNLSNSDTDVEEDSPLVRLVTSGPTTAAAQSDTDADIVAVEQDNPNEITLDSDTDVEDKDADIQEPGDNQIPIQGCLLLNSSTPVRLSEGNIEEMETQAFLSPSIRYAVAPAGRPGTSSYCLDSQEDDDFVVAETQSYILPHGDPNQSSGLASIVNEKDVVCATFQLEFSDSSHLQSQAYVLAMESTQAFDSVDGGVNQEETQPYAYSASSTDGEELPVDIALQATQAYISEPYNNKEDETPEDKTTEPVLTTSVPEVEHLVRKDDTSVPQSNHDTLFKTKEEAGQATLYKQAKVLSIAETQPMSTDEESDSDESVSSFRKRKAKQIQEEETQPLQNTEFTVAETQPMNWNEDKESDEDSPPVFRKRKAKQLPSEEEQTQPIALPKDEQSEEDSIQIVRKRKEKHLDPEEETQPFVDSELTLAETQPISITKNGESDREDSVPVAINRKAKQLQPEDQETQPLVNSELSVAPTQPIVLSEDMGSDDDDSFLGPRKRKAKPLEDTPPLTKSADTQNSETTISKEGEGTSEAGTSKVSVRSKVGARTRLRKEEQAVAEQVRAEPPTRQRKGKSKAVCASRKVKPRVDHEDENEEETQRTKDDLEETEEKNVVTERLEQQRGEEKKRLEKEREEQEGKEMAALIQKEKEEKQKEILEKEKRAQEENMRMERKQKEREDKERLETAKRSEEEVKRLEVERKDQEHKAQLEMDEKERLKEDQTPRRGRRTIAAPESSTAANDDFPAGRTRSRSNSSNSVNSERSVPSINSQNSKGRGRGQGARRTDVPVQNTASRASNRRKMAAAETSVQVRSRSNSSNSLNSEISSCSVSSQRKGRGGRQRGRGGRRTEAEPESVCSVSAQSDQPSMQKTLQRAKRSNKISNQEKADSQQSVSTRGQGGARKKPSECTPEYEEDQSNQEEACSDNPFQKSEMRLLESPGTSLGTVDNVRRKGRKREMETNAKIKMPDSKTKFQKTEEAEDARATSTQTRSSVKKDVKEDSLKTEEPRVKDQPSVVQKKKRGNREDSGPSGNNSMEQEANPETQEPQTPTGRASRRRHSANSDSSPVAKTPRSSTASPSTFGRLRATSQAYKVQFTGVVDKAGEKVLSFLGGSIANDVADMNCLVTDKVRRTVKFLCAVAKGIPIITTEWLEKSGKAGTFLSPSAYIVKDSEQEHKFNFILKDSLRIASRQPLLQGYEIHVTKSVKPEPLHMKDIIFCSGAKFLPRMPSSNKPQTLVISCEEDWSFCGPAVSSAIPVVTAEFILTGILQQKLDFETHALSGPMASVQPTAARGRSRKKT